MISVVIATLNRADALRDISLPSLLRQDTGDFEAIVWDASEDDLSEKVCGDFFESFRQKGAALKYTRAPRKGLASQRNDAAKTAQGSEVFFIDDDCEISVDAISSLDKCFRSFPWLYGAGLPMLNKTPASGNSALLKIAARLFGMKNTELKRMINSSGGLSLPIKDLPGPAEWLSGGSMAFKTEVFGELGFDERLEIFGGYALEEDKDFSHRVFLRFRQPLMVAHGGYVIHHAASGGNRNIGLNKIAASWFNPALIRHNFAQYGKRFSPLMVAWGSLATILALLRSGASPVNIVRGWQMARKELRKQMKQG